MAVRGEGEERKAGPGPDNGELSGPGEEWETLAKSRRITSRWMQSSFAGLR